MPRGRPRGSKNRPKPSETETGASEAPQNEGEDGEGEGENEKPTLLSNEQKVELFESYQNALDELDELRGALTEAEQQVQDSIADIAKKLGTGPFEWKGEVIVAVQRKVRGSDKKHYYFKTFGADVQKIG